MTNIHPSADVATTEKFVFNGIHFRLSTTEEIATPRLKSCRGAALALAYKYGWHVFPVPPGTKKSYKAAKYSGGQNWGMTSDPDRICRDFTRWPDAGVGIPTGEINLIWVVEADTVEGHGVDGVGAMKVLQEKYGPLPITRQAVSPSGSVHWYFNWPDGVVIKNSTSRIATGIDVRGEGGMVVAPPTVRRGDTYRWLNHEPVADAPPWLIELATRSGDSEAHQSNGDGEAHQNSEPQAEINRIAEAMAVIPNDKDSFDDWNIVGMTIYAATGGCDGGFRIFDTWSQQWPGYDADDTEARWRAYHRCPPTRIGAGSIFHWAEEACPGYETLATFPDHEVTRRIAAFMKAAEIEPAQPEELKVDPQPNPEPQPEDKSSNPEFFSTWWCDVKAIPQRRWLYGQHYIRGHASTTIADGGMGKTTLAIIEAICIATGRPLLGQQPKEQCSVWYWNGEEPRDEIARRVHAVCVRYGIDPYELAKTFRFTSGLDEFPIKIVIAAKRGIVVNDTLLKTLAAQIRDNEIGLMFLDPFISCHGVPENDNVAIDTVAKAWARLAAETNSAVELPHHTRKAMRGDNGDAQAADARGAGALINAVRSSRVFNPMSEKEAGQFDVHNRSEFFRVNRGKVNMVRPGGGSWYRLVSVDIGNSADPNDPFGDNVQTVVAWDPPDAMQDVTDAHAHAVRAKVAAGDYRRDYRAKDAWVGAVIADVIGLDPEQHRPRIEQVIKAWLKRGVIKEVPRYDSKVRHDRVFIEPTEDWIG